MDLPFELQDKDLFQPDCFVHGKWTATKSNKRFEVEDPGTGKVWTTCADSQAEDVDEAVQSAHEAFLAYSKYTPRRRAQLLMAWHQLILAARDDLARILVYETGKPLAEAQGELDYSTGFTWWFAGEADRVQGSVYSGSVAGRRVLVIKQPLGVAAALCPWNFPIAMVLRKAGAALAAGCTMVVKPSPETPITTLCLANLAVRAGFPPGALNVLTTSLDNTPPVAEALCLHPLVKKVTFTGSTRVGKIISGLCARNLKKVTLELGGNCPFVVFDDADLEQALGQLMALKWRHAGQACISANRVYVQAGVHDKFVEMLAAKTKQLKVGHGIEEGTTMGPVTTPRGLDKAEHLHQDAVAKGAKVIMGTGKREQQGGGGGGANGGATGYFMAPTILTGITDDMELAREEMFAPVLGVFRFDTEDDAVKKANDTSMGLASYVFTKNVDRLWRMFERLEAGMIGLNTGNQSAAESPFGGIKESGLGKESGKDVAVDEYLISKTGTLTLQDHY
ncbi:putative succinate-semialdehyde dehydrogenase [Cryphonectria parasitica EP155]|uniref:Succinate-semialdehyde dehydrogenase n=1 Tax=Cryphonectria parasitica (strain ATCC 38755 / EP155) TaxID=660469 RepID=A0A9P5CKW6_CRYP1|nr:putative succinate-semialdehyde dehydrogenase [Cryphonectria parasitica EP155]KAF3762694.1 putative succinate-semialdehyde dehydrogenase [Cryphonectria parasitica EP155]